MASNREKDDQSICSNSQPAHLAHLIDDVRKRCYKEKRQSLYLTTNKKREERDEGHEARFNASPDGRGAAI